MIARRNLVIGAAAGLAGVGAVGFVPGGAAFAAALPAIDGGAGGIAARFRQLVGETFTARTGGARLHLRLARVDEHAVTHPFEQLTVTFEEISGRSGPEHTYAVRQIGGGAGGYRGDLFLQPGEAAGRFTAALSVAKS